MSRIRVLRMGLMPWGYRTSPEPGLESFCCVKPFGIRRYSSFFIGTSFAPEVQMMKILALELMTWLTDRK
jgi:hypothetical protein